jgi:hypothetical protein
MRLADIALVNIPASPEGSTLRGTPRLLRDLVAVGVMQEVRPSVSERLESKLGSALTRALFGSLGAGPDAQGLRPRRAA